MLALILKAQLRTAYRLTKRCSTLKSVVGEDARGHSRLLPVRDRVRHSRDAVLEFASEITRLFKEIRRSETPRTQHFVQS